MGIMDNAGGSAVKFEPGVSAHGRVLGISEYNAEYNGKPKVTAAGKQIVGYRIDLATTEGETVSVWADAWRQVRAIQDAVVASGALDIVPGGTLTVTCTGTEQGKGSEPAKTYSAVYVPPGSGMMATATPAPQGPPPATGTQRPDHISETVWEALSADQRVAVVGAAPY